jgi:hypothetical protein
MAPNSAAKYKFALLLIGLIYVFGLFHLLSSATSSGVVLYMIVSYLSLALLLSLERGGAIGWRTPS